MKQLIKPGRIEAFDFLRGYFIIVIIIDHLYRWPSFLTIFTGQALLWSNASDGFIIIAGLLIGYIRGFKAKDAPFKDVAKKLAKRGVGLYFWSIGISIIFVAIQWTLTFKVSMPNIDPPQGDWGALLYQTITLSYSHPWVFFLHLYTILMILAIPAIWLIRRNLSWVLVVLSIIGLACSQFYPNLWLERQALFFIPAIVGFHLDAIRAWITSLSSPAQNKLSLSIIGFFLVTLTLSVLWQFWPEIYSPAVHEALATIFKRSPISFGATIIGFVWFIGLFALTQRFLPFIKKWLTWLVLPFGRLSLSAYIVHGVPILITSYLFTLTTNVWLNTLMGIFSVFLIWSLIHLPIVKRLIPQ